MIYNRSRTITFSILVLVLAIVFAGGSPKAAYTSTDDKAANGVPGLPEVTVIAPRPPKASELEGEAVSNFIHAHARPTLVTGQLARWRVGPCPATVGLSPAFNQFVSARILAIAANVGALPSSAAPCKQNNVLIVFTTDPQKTLDSIIKRDARLLGFHYPRQTQNLATVSQPIQGWYVTSTRGDDGDEALDEAMPLLPLQVGILNQGVRPPGRPGSHFGSGVSSAIVNVLIVADLNIMVGYEIGTISDYLAVLTLTQVFASSSCGELPSITDLLLPDCGAGEKPTAITAGDLAFLKALYKSNMTELLSLERSDIRNNMIRQLNEH